MSRPHRVHIRITPGWLESIGGALPLTENCAPCERDAWISPDGRLLAYRHGPDSIHPDSPYYSGSACGGSAEQVDGWWEGSQNVTAEIVVLDLERGEELWRTDAPADFRLSDFGGRYLWLRVMDKASSTTPLAYDLRSKRRETLYYW